MAFERTSVVAKDAGDTRALNDNAQYEGNAYKQDAHVESNYQGTDADQRDMHALGRIQELRV